MTQSHGLELLLQPLENLIAQSQYNKLMVAQWENLMFSLKKIGKRGNGTYYPTDLKRLDVILECIHDVTGSVLVARVVDGNFEKAIEQLRNLFNQEEKNHVKFLL